MTATTMDLQTLPAPRVVEALSFESILAAAKADFAERMRPHLPVIDDILKLESDPVVKLLESHAFRELLFRARVNDAARAHLLAYAAGADLDHIGGMFGVPRMTDETDERFRKRLQLRIAALGAQGTREYYEFHALTASPWVRAVKASRPAPGHVLVMLWLTDQAQAQTVRELVDGVLNADAARMLGVELTVAVAVPKVIDITARITRTRNSPGNLLGLLRQRVLDAFETMHSLSDSVARSYFTSLLHVQGVHAVEFPQADAPAVITAIGTNEYPVPGVVNLIDAGVVS